MPYEHITADHINEALGRGRELVILVGKHFDVISVDESFQKLPKHTFAGAKEENESKGQTRLLHSSFEESRCAAVWSRTMTPYVILSRAQIALSTTSTRFSCSKRSLAGSYSAKADL